MDINALKNCGTLRTCRKGAFLCREGGAGGSAFIVLKGAVSVVLNTFTENPKVVAVVEPGAFVGEMSLFLNKSRTASVVAREPDTIVLEIKPEEFKNFLMTDPGTCYKLMKTLIGRIDDMCSKLYEYSMRYVKECKEEHYYQLGSQLGEPKFTQMAAANPNGAVKLLKSLCGTLSTLNDRYLQH